MSAPHDAAFRVMASVTDSFGETLIFEKGLNGAINVCILPVAGVDRARAIVEADPDTLRAMLAYVTATPEQGAVL